MKRPRELTYWEFPDTIDIPDGYERRSIPDMTRDNFNLLVEDYNNLVEVVDALLNVLEPTGIVFEEE